MLRTEVKAINIFTDMAMVGTSRIGKLDCSLPIDRYLDLKVYTGLRVGDILKCDGSPYRTKDSAKRCNKKLMKRSSIVKVGEDGFAIRFTK